MAYGRRKSFSSKGAKRPYKRGRSSYGSAARTFSKQLTRVKNRAIANLRTGGLIGIETKFLDLARTQPDLYSLHAQNCVLPPYDLAADDAVMPLGLPGYTAPQAFGTAGGNARSACLSAPAIGSTANSRDGRQIRAVDISIIGCVTRGLGSPVGASVALKSVVARPPTVYVALVMDLQTNGSAEGIPCGDVFSFPAGANNALEPMSFVSGGDVFRNIEHLPRYRVLAFKKLLLDSNSDITSTGTNVLGASTRNFRLFRRLAFPIQFLADSTQASEGAWQRTSVSDRSICLVAWTTHAPTGDENTTVCLSYSSRFRWVG